jgi:hypothetical protein
LQLVAHFRVHFRPRYREQRHMVVKVGVVVSGRQIEPNVRAKKMTPDQIAEAHWLAREWRPTK